ncbi:MAG TPA: phosphatidylglycerol lysyltransferase domain-containing protein [Thermomicrobiaceae bacterium]|nr:phosphatidylglycerol lysyltransferase domain-containing protein [Thermomicrobiaceae bacterium]
MPRRGFYAFHSTPRLLIAALVASIGAANVVAALARGGAAYPWSWSDLVPFAVLHGTRSFIVLAGLFLILLGNGLLHGRRTAWATALLLLGGVTLSQLARGVDLDTTGITLGAVALLLWRRHEFRARPDVPTVARALRLAALALLLVAAYVAAGFLALHGQFAPAPSPGLGAWQALTRMAFLSGPVAGTTWKGRWFLDSITVAWTGVVAFSLFQILRPVVRPTVDTPRDRERARALLRRYGAATTSYMTTWSGNTILLDGARGAYLAYRLIGGVALVLGDPIGTPEGCAAVIDEFVDLAAQNGWTPCIYGANRAFLVEYARHGLAALQVGEEAVIDLTTLEFRGKSWQDVRTALNRARREGVAFRLIDQASADPAVVRQLRTISRDWMADKKLPEMGFTLGTLADPPDPEVRTAIAIDGAGRIQAFATWLPVYAGRGWAIDMMRRREDAFPGVMEFLIAQSALAFKAEGAAFASLSAAPLAWVSRDGEGRTLERALAVVADRLDALYNFGSLYDFKRKFQPRWEPLYLVHPGAASLPRIGYAVLRAYLPELSLEDVRALLAGAIDAVPRPRRGHDHRSPRNRPAPRPPTAREPVGVGTGVDVPGR